MGSHSTAKLPSAFRRLAWSNLAAQSAEQIGLAATPIVAVLAFGAGAGATGLLQTAHTLPFLLMSIPAGVVADRMSRAKLMASAEALRVASLLAILVLIAFGGLTLPLLAGLGFLGACGTVAYSVAAPALVPALVKPAALPVANGRIELARTIAFAAGPAIGGALVGWMGGGPAFAAAAALSIFAVVLLVGLREPPRAPTPTKHPWQDLREGAAFVFRHPLLRPILVTQFIFNVAFFMIQAAYVPFAIGALGLTPAGVGMTLGAFGAGMVTGALAAAAIMRVLSLGIVIAIGPISGFLAALVMALTIWTPSPLFAGLSFFLMGAGPLVWVVSTTTLRQTVTPQHLLGRVSAINSAVYGARPIGAALGAMVGGLYGAEACLILAAVGFLAQMVVILASPVPALGREPTRAASAANG
ncbi:MAG TPA: MFS transporter [Xanthobacteraceae bacterium]|nr:MFS transporter [Xanthobacteraceae bacterium]